MSEKQRTIYNRIVSKSRNSTGYAGVMKHWNDFVAVIKYKGRTHRIGVYSSALEAHKAYLRTARQLGIKIKVKK